MQTDKEIHRGLQKIDEGDEVVIETTNGETLALTCVSIDKQYPSGAARRAGIIRETTIWEFEYTGGTVFAAITNGLKERKEMDDFPRYSALYNSETDENYGYITLVKHDE